MAVIQLIEILTDFLNTEKLLSNGVQDTYTIVSDPKQLEGRDDIYRSDWVSVSLVRNLPQNYEEIASIVAMLGDKVPDSYLYELLWFIDDPQKALDEMKAQKAETAKNNLSVIGYTEENFNGDGTDPNKDDDTNVE